MPYTMYVAKYMLIPSFRKVVIQMKSRLSLTWLIVMQALWILLLLLIEDTNPIMHLLTYKRRDGNSFFESKMLLVAAV